MSYIIDFMDNLIETWLEVECVCGLPVAQAIRDLNNVLNTHYTPQDFYKWRRGDRSVPQKVQDYMRRVAVSHALYKALGINTLLFSDEQLDRLIDLLSPPKRRQSKG